MAQFRVNGKVYELATDITLDEWCDAEDAFGTEINTSAKRSRAFIWVSLRRAGETIQPEEIGNLELGALFAPEADARPPVLGLAEQSNGSGEPSNGSDITEPPSSIGSLGSDTGSDSARATFFTALRAS